MKNKFITSFLEIIWEVIGEIPDLIGNLVIRESMQRKILRMGGFDPDVVYGGFKNLRYRGLLKYDGSNYQFTRKGKVWLKKSRMRWLQLKPGKWDGKWRVVIFDIPERLRQQRNMFRSKLKALNFYMLQKSVFVCPFPCEEELGWVTGYLGIGDYVDVVTAVSVGFKESEIKEHFGL